MSTPEYTQRVAPAALNYLKETFKSKVGRYPTTREEFTLLDLYNKGTSAAKYTEWQADVVDEINREYLGTTGPEAIYELDANSFSGRISSITVNGASSKNEAGYLWHMMHTEYTTSSFTKSTPPAGGMMHLNGYLRVNDSQGEFDYIIIDESFLVNSCTTTICDIEP